MISQSAQIIRKLASIAVFASVMAGCGSQPTMQSESAATNSTTPGASSVAQQAAAVALRQVGTPYQFGGSSPRGFDCSGLVHYAYASTGKRVPRTTTALWNKLRPVANDDLRTGDVLFFSIAGKMSHVGMYVGSGQFVHAPSTGKVVAIASLRSDFYSNALIGAGRPD